MKFLLLLGALSMTTAIAGCAADQQDDETEDMEALEGQGPIETQEQALHRKATWKEPTPSDRATALAAHAGVDPQHMVPRDLLGAALGFYDLNQAKLGNTKYVSVIDFQKHSGSPRFFIVNVQTGHVESHVVAHGSGSDPSYTGYARHFSNTPSSNASSVGFYVTAETYYGVHGRSLRLDGLSDTNSNVHARAIVVHGASYVDDGRAKQGRSQGCPAVSYSDIDGIIAKLKGGSVIYAQRTGHVDD